MPKTAPQFDTAQADLIHLLKPFPASKRTLQRHRKNLVLRHGTHYIGGGKSGRRIIYDAIATKKTIQKYYRGLPA